MKGGIKKVNIKKCVVSALLLCTTFSASAEEKEKPVSLDFGADFVSSYIWRGLSCAGFSTQPYVSIAWNRTGIEFGVWANAELFQNSTFANTTEFDLILSYNPIEQLTLTVTDYSFCNKHYWREWTFNQNSSHNLEGTIAYDFGFLSASWNTCLTGLDHWDSGKRAYSTYIELSTPFKIGGVDCSATVGACPWGYSFGAVEGSGFMVTNIAFGAKKILWKIPVFANVIFNPKAESTYFVVGISL